MLSLNRVEEFDVKIINVCCCLIVAATIGAAQTAPLTSAGDAKNGKRLYKNYGCYQCHGYEGQGAQSTGPRLGPDPIPFSEFAAYLRGPRGEMPPYTAKVVSDQDMADIYAFLKSLPHPPDARSISLLH